MNKLILTLATLAVLVACQTVVASLRPQNPTNRPYIIEEVRVASKNGVVLAGEYTRPQGAGPFEAMVLITGSGPQDRDQTVAGHKPNLVLSDHLTKAGYAVLRYDDRGVNMSTGDYATADLQDFAHDAASAVAWLKAQPQVNAAKVGYVGTSEGGLIAPVAAQLEPVDFMVLLAAPVRPLFPDVLQDQAVDRLKVQGADQAAIDREIEQTRTLTRLLKQDKPLAEIRNDLDAYLVQEGLTDKQREQTLALFGTRWAVSYANHDPALALAAFEGPVLGLFASKDRQVLADREAHMLARNLSNPRSKVHTLNGLNHLFQPTSTGLISEYSSIDITMAPEALAFITNWLDTR